MIRNIAVRQSRRNQAALQLACLRGADDGAFQVRIAAHLDLEAAIARLDGTLLLHAGVVVVHLALAIAAAEACAKAHGTAGGHALALAIELGRILQTFQVQITLDVGNDLVGASYCTLDVGIATAADDQLVARIYMRIELRRAIAILVSLAAADAGSETGRHALCAHNGLHAYRSADTRTLAVLAFHILRRQQIDVVVGMQANIILRVQVAAQDIDIAILTAAQGRDVDIVTRQNAAAMRHAGRVLRLYAFRMPRRQADADAWPALLHHVCSGSACSHGSGRGCHRRHTTILGCAGCLAHGLQGLDGADHAAT
ncbi:hypothetical protein D3C81_972810 [compost metagenome]